MEIFQAIILGIVEGFTEFLPISSTAHLSLTSDLLELKHSEFLKSFEISIQLGAILAVLFLYWGSFKDINTWKKLIVAFIPTGIIGLIFYSFVKQNLIGNSNVALSALAIGGLILIIFEKIFVSTPSVNSLRDLSYKKSFLIGLFQSISIIPGVSRAAATIVGGMLIGIKRTTIVEFSFLLAVPTMAAAVGLDLIKTSNIFSVEEWVLLGIGFIVSFVTAIASIKFLLSYIQKHSFVSFGIYRIALVAAFLILGFAN